MAQGRGLVGAFAALMTGACVPEHEDGPVRWVGDRVEVVREDDARVCAGVVAWLDAAVDDIEGRTGIPAGDRIRVLWGRGWVEGRCPDWAGGCLSGGAIVADTFSGMRHELAHAIGSEHPTIRLVEEGYAEYYAGGCWSDAYESSLAELIGLSGEEFVDAGGYLRAGHLMAYVASVHGEPAVMALKRAVPSDSGADGLSAGLLAVTGDPLDVFEMRMHTEAPHRLCEGHLDPPHAVLNEGDVTRLDAVVDCDAADAFGPLDARPTGGYEHEVVDAPYVVRVLDVPRAMEATLTLEGPTESFARLYTGECEDATGGGLLALDAGESLDFMLPACRWHVVLGGAHDRVTEVALTITPEGA